MVYQYLSVTQKVGKFAIAEHAPQLVYSLSAIQLAELATSARPSPMTTLPLQTDVATQERNDRLVPILL